MEAIKFIERIIGLFVVVSIIFCGCRAAAQVIPPDTTKYLATNESGVTVKWRRPHDSLMIPGEVLIRFRGGALDTSKLMTTFYDYFASDRSKEKGKEPQSGPLGGGTVPRGWPIALRSQLFADRFCLSDASNIIKDLSLRDFLVGMGGHCLRRLTPASPIDTLSVTRTGDTIGCDHANWMILSFDSSKNPLLISYFLTTQWSKDVLLATPNYSGILQMSPPSKHPADSYYGCQLGQSALINAETAWGYEVGHDSILLAGYDAGCDYMHPDLGAGKGIGHHVLWAWEYTSRTDSGARFQPGHGTPCFGIMGALTNNILPFPFGGQSVAGIAGGWHNLPPDTVNPNVPPNGGASLLIFADYQLGTEGYVSLMFEAAAHSPSSAYGLGVHVMNNPVVVWYDSSTGLPVHAAVNYLFENGVVLSAARDDSHANTSGNGSMRLSYPA